MQAATVQVMTERPPSQSDVMVRAVAGAGQINDGKPVAGFFMRRRYHGDTFFIQNADEFSTRWMEFVDAPPESWVANIKKREKDWENRSSFEERKAETAREPKTMAEVNNLAKIDSGAFDYSNGGPRKKKPRLVLE